MIKKLLLQTMGIRFLN